MIQPDQIITNIGSQAKGLYESFYFRGNNTAKKQSFWLKHNLLIYRGSPQVKIESTLILFDQESGLVKTIRQEEALSLERFLNLKAGWGEGWRNFQFEFSNGGHLLVTPSRLRGRLRSESGEASWDLSLTPSRDSYYHFSKNWFYRAGFPKKKILTNDIQILFDGFIEAGGLSISGKFVGMNGHNWGTEHAYKYAYANCNQFDGETDIYFDGFSAKIALGGGLVKSPYLSCGSLRIKGSWYHFNQVHASWRHQVKKVAQKLWQGRFISESFELEFEIDGRESLWVTLLYDHPSRRQSLVHNTKFAHGELKLIRRANQKVEAVLRSDWFELETLIPGADALTEIKPPL